MWEWSFHVSFTSSSQRRSADNSAQFSVIFIKHRPQLTCLLENDVHELCCRRRRRLLPADRQHLLTQLRLPQLRHRLDGQHVPATRAAHPTAQPAHHVPATGARGDATRRAGHCAITGGVWQWRLKGGAGRGTHTHGVSGRTCWCLQLQLHRTGARLKC